jgi:hypothetical protein
MSFSNGVMSFSLATYHNFWRLLRRAYGATILSGTPNLQKPLPVMTQAFARSPFTRWGFRWVASLIRRAALWRGLYCLPNPCRIHRVSRLPTEVHRGPS